MDRIKDFNVPTRRLQVREITNEGTLEAAATIGLGGNYLEGVLQADRGSHACRTEEKIDRQWNSHRKANPHSKRSEFTPILTDGDCLNVRQFELVKQGEVWGVWYLYNVVELPDNERRGEVRALMAPGIPFENVVEWTQNCIEIMKAFMRRRVREGGRSFQIVELDFPTDEVGHRWFQKVNGPYGIAMRDIILPAVIGSEFVQTNRIIDGASTPHHIRRRA